MNKVELLAEAFNLDSLKLNIENGCDAVYIGDELKNFSNSFELLLYKFTETIFLSIF